jgi:hypothetical protein
MSQVSTERALPPVFLDPEIVSFFPDETQAELASGRLWLDEHDFLLAAALPRPIDPVHGIQEGESLVVARITPDGVFTPERRIAAARVTMARALLRDAADGPDGPCIPLWLSHQRPYVYSNAQGRMLQVEEHLYVPSSAYGVWLLGNTALHPFRTGYLSLMPDHNGFTLHIGARPAPVKESAQETGEASRNGYDRDSGSE